MTKFEKAKFKYFGGYLRYDDKFVARFKYRNVPITKAKFVKQLMKNFTVEEYFAALEAGGTPVGILKENDFAWYRKTMNDYYGCEVLDAEGKVVK